jgi:Zn finger protein HypA/HybF involved in hydrogenase expression
MEKNVCVTSLERSCIACPASWKGQTSDENNIYIRFRGGVFRIKIGEKDIPDDTIHEESIGGAFDGYMNAREVREKLRMMDFQVEDEIASSFYNIPSEECKLELIGSWFDKMYCEDCTWNVGPSNVEKVEFETVIPDYCPNCESDIQIETSKPDRLDDLTEN